MADRKTLTFVLMDPPYENARTTTALRLLDIAARRGYNINVFAYEGAVSMAFAKQAPHPNAVHGRDTEQEDHPNPVIWLTQAMKGAGGDFDVLLKGNAVNYAVKGQDASGLSFGDRKQTQPPRLDDDLVKLGAKGIQVFIVKEDLGRRGISDADLVPGMKSVLRADLPGLFEDYAQIWHW